MNLLLHTCCGSCLLYPYSQLQDEFHVTAFYDNPNIHPSGEYLKRQESLVKYCREHDIDLIISDYDPMPFFAVIKDDLSQPDRCRHCYRLRLKRTAKMARARDCEAFSTTLLVSPYQQHDVLHEIGESIAEEEGIRFIYHDWRPGFPQARREANKADIYSQKYCGCIFSEYEAYRQRQSR